MTYTIELENGVVRIDPQATEINLTNQQLSDESLKRVLRIFDHISIREHIKKLLLGHNRITYVGACSIAESIRLGFSRLDTLDLSYNSIGDNGFEIISSTIRRQNPNPCPSLRKIDISCNGITSTGAIYINKLIRRTDGIVSVLFDNNPISGEGLGHIVASKYWESFSVINTKADEAFLQFVQAYRERSDNLRDLVIMNNQLSPNNILLLSPMLTNTSIPTLQTLTIRPFHFSTQF